jgi:hypothetical protein
MSGEEEIRRLEEAREQVEPFLLTQRDDPQETSGLRPDPLGSLWHNVVGIGVAPKIKQGSILDSLAVTVYVRAKYSDTDLGDYDVKKILHRTGLSDDETDVVQVGRLTSFGGWGTPRIVPRTALAVGAEVAMAGRTTRGTICAFVRRPAEGPNGPRYLLSSGHVLDPHGGFFKLVLSGGRVVAKVTAPPATGPSDVTMRRHPYPGFPPQWDAVLAQLESTVSPDFDLPGDEELASVRPIPAHRKMRVEKRGRFIAEGTVICPRATILVDYPNKSSILTNQILVCGHPLFAEQGDSGSMVVHKDRNGYHAVGMVIAAGDASILRRSHRQLPPQVAVVTPMQGLLDSLHAELVIE